MGGFTETTSSWRGKGKGGGKGRGKGRGGYRGTGLDSGSMTRPEDQFLLANYRLMIDTPAHTKSLNDSVKWQSVQEACSISEQDFSCPICMEFPTAAKITKCGHYFCLPCLLMCMCKPSDETEYRGDDNFEGTTILQTNTPIPCPFCNRDIMFSDLKPLTHQHSSTKREVESFTALVRAPNALYCRPVNNGYERVFNQYYEGTESEIISVSQREIEELHERLFRLQALLLKADDIRLSNTLISCIEIGLKMVREKVQSQTKYFENHGRSKHPNIKQKRPDGIVLFQASDGRRMYIHPTQAKIISSLNTYGTENQSWGTDLRLPVKELFMYTQSPSTRILHPDLSHVPIGSVYYIARLDLEKIESDSKFLLSGVKLTDIGREEPPTIVENNKVHVRETKEEEQQQETNKETLIATTAISVMESLSQLELSSDVIIKAIAPHSIEEVTHMMNCSEERIINHVMEQLSNPAQQQSADDFQMFGGVKPTRRNRKR